MNKFFLGLTALLSSLFADNQTETLSPIFPEDTLPFTIEVNEASFSLPTGLQAYASAIYQGKWILLAGRTNGLHGFSDVGNNFPPNFQNTEVFVIDPSSGLSLSRSLEESGLERSVIDCLSVTAPEFFQEGRILYLVGGYGINTLTEEMETKSTLTAIDLKKLIAWVDHQNSSLTSAIKQVSHPYLQVTGGALFRASPHHPFLLTLGQNFSGLYRDGSNGIYTQQIRTFWLNDMNGKLTLLANPSNETKPDYRRRDLNVVPILRDNRFAYVAFAGVFTLTTGVWTVPITINPDGSSVEPNPLDPSTFKQGMNQYNCASFGLYSTKSKEMFVIFPGGISFGYYQNGVFATDSEFPFINQITTVKIDKKNNFTQYLMNSEYPTIPSTGSNPGNPLLFGAEATFFPKDGIPLYRNGVIQLDKIKEPMVIGYIAGGIMSTLPNTNTISDSTSSPYVFTVTLTPR